MTDSLTLRRAQGRLLLRPSARTIRWSSFGVVAAVGALAVWTGGRKGGNPASIALPVATTLLCVWLCFLFEDLAAETTAASATPLLFRRAVRAAIGVPAIVAVWLVYTWIGPLTGPTGVMLGAFGAEIVLALAAAAVVSRVVESSRSGLSAAAAVIGIVLVLPVVFRRPPSVDPAHPPFGDPFAYWLAVAIASCAILAFAHTYRLQRR